MQGALDTLTRLVMLVLAGMVSLSLIGAIAAMSNQAVPSIPFERQRVPVSSAEPVGQREPSPPRPGPGGVPAAGAPTAIAVPAAPEADPIERWLEAIFYALMAIAGLVALLCVILWRALGQLRRLADARENADSRDAQRPSARS